MNHKVLGLAVLLIVVLGILITTNCGSQDINYIVISNEELVTVTEDFASEAKKTEPVITVNKRDQFLIIFHGAFCCRIFALCEEAIPPHPMVAEHRA